MGGLLGRALAYSTNGVVRYFMLEGMRRRLSSAELSMYLAPFSASVDAPLQLARPTASDYLAEIEAGLGKLKGFPVLLAWATGDFAFRGDYLARFKTAFPNHELMHLANAGHFWQGDAAAEVAPAIETFVSRIS